MATISNNDIARAIYLASKDEAGKEEFSSRVVNFLAKKRLLPKAKDILFRLNKIINDEGGIAEAKVSSKKELSGEIKKQLEHSLSKRYGVKEVVIRSHLDESLLGGFKVEVNDEVIDMTIKNRIGKLQEYLTKKV